MADSTTFRTAVEPQAEAPAPEGKDPGNVIEGAKENTTPIALYHELKGKPYSAVYFEVGDIWDRSESLKADLMDIDEYYRNQVSSGKLADGVDSFKALIHEAEKITQTKNANFNLKVGKIAEFVKFMNRMDEVERNSERYAN